METPTSALLPGTVITGPERAYTVRKVLGQGGFGITYLVTAQVRIGNINVQCDFAVKELFINTISWRDTDSRSVRFSPTAAAEIDNSLKSFIKEAQRLQTLGVDDPNIVKINEVFEANNTAYYVMEYLSGRTLEDYVRRAGRLSLAETNFFIEPIIRAVADLHRRQVTHYDIKPLNIILAESEGKVRPVLIDFGLAKHYDHKGHATSTNSGGGYSPGYAPIEQYAGLTTFTPQADVYAIAATMYYCLTGNQPDEAFILNHDSIVDELGGPAVSVAPVIARAMSLSLKDRQADAGELYRELYEAAGSGEPAPAPASRSTVPLSAPTATLPPESTATVRRVATPPPSTPTVSKSTADIHGTEVSQPTVAQGPGPAKSRSGLKMILVALVVLVIAAVIIMTTTNRKSGPNDPDMITAVEESASEAVDTFMAADPESVEDEFSREFSEYTTPTDMALCVAYNGHNYFFPYDVWSNLSADKRQMVEVKGLTVIGNGEQFVLALKDEGPIITWHEAMARYGSQLPTKAQARVLADKAPEIQRMLKAFGGKKMDYWHWTSTEYSPGVAWYIYMNSYLPDNGDRLLYQSKDYTSRIRFTTPLN